MIKTKLKYSFVNLEKCIIVIFGFFMETKHKLP